MSKQIKLGYEGKKFTLEFTRESVSNLEMAGFKLRELDEKGMTQLPLLVEGAFLAHHPDIDKKLVDEIFEHIPDKKGFALTLVDMFDEPYKVLMAEPKKNDPKNVDWKANF